MQHRQLLKFQFIFVASLLLGALPTPSAAAGKPHLRCSPFGLEQVRLLPSRFYDNFRRDSAWLMSVPVNGLLHSFRTTAGVYAGREGGYMTQKKLGGWESLDCDLRGHITGHWLSAMASLYAQTRSAAVKAKADSVLQGLLEVQRQYGTGYLSAYGEGLIDRNIQGKSVWAPWYTLHKIMQGLIDQSTLCGNDTALAMARRMGLWAYEKTKGLNEDTRRRMLRNEFGGFNETLYELYALTSDPAQQKAFLRTARFFYDNAKIDPLKQGNDDLGTNHANTFIPKLLGECRNYELFGPTDSRCAAETLFRTLACQHAFVTGELSDKEHLFPPSDQYKHLSGYDGENCCTFNLLKLAEHILSWSGDIRVTDYQERALYNHILGQQDPATSMVTYFTPLQTGAYRLYSTRDSSYWCCVGSGFESHVRYASYIYAHSDDDLMVNLYIPSRVTWQGVTLSQHGCQPSDTETTLVVDSGSRRFTMMLRLPYWASSATVRVNGKPLRLPRRENNSSQWLPINRYWQKGDRLTVTFRTDLREEAVKGDDSRVALCYGPLVLAGKLDSVAHPFSDPKLYNDYYTYDYHIPDSLDTLTELHDLSDVRHIGGTHFRAATGLDIIPFADAHHCRYCVYWKKKTTK